MNSYTYSAFLDELVKIARGGPAGEFALSGLRAITRTPARAVKGEVGALRGSAGDLQKTIMESEGLVARQQAAAEAKRQGLERMLQEGKVDPKLHDMKRFMQTGEVVPRAPVQQAAVRPSQETTKVLMPQAPASKPQATPAQTAAPAPRAPIQAPPPMAMTPQNIQRVQRPAPAATPAPAAPAQAAPAPQRMGLREMLGFGVIPATVGFGAYQAGQASA